MAIYKMPHSGNKIYRTRRKFTPRKLFTLTYGEVFPVVQKFVLPGDVWKIGANCLIRYKPTLAPILTQSSAFFRFFFVPLRQVVDNLEEIITGSKNGALIGDALPTCPNFIKEWLSKKGNISDNDDHCVVHKYSYWAALGVRPTPYREMENPEPLIPDFKVFWNYDGDKDSVEFPAGYHYKAYCRVIWDFFRDENYQSFDGDFEKFYEYMLCNKDADNVKSNGWYYGTDEWQNIASKGGDNLADYYGIKNFKIWFCDIRKDYFMSSLPWIMKGVQPTINSVMHADFSGIFAEEGLRGKPIGIHNGENGGKFVRGFIDSDGFVVNDDTTLLDTFNNNKITDGGFTAQDIRDMFADTRVFERLARCGSRYVEYLEANFGIAPRDDTLQRPLYLGGFEQPIVTTEVVQTGGSDNGDVGTLRGHGISSGGNRIKPFVATEFGIILGLMYVTPKTQYQCQLKRELSYKSRFDFVNPSFQNLSEQQVSSLELSTPLGKLNHGVIADDVKTFVEFDPLEKTTIGYQGMYNELRYDNDIICRDLADTEAYWTQAIDFYSSNPLVSSDIEDWAKAIPLNGINICIGSYLGSLLKPFEGVDGGFKPMIVDFGLNAEVYRPLVRDPIPGLVDHN